MHALVSRVSHVPPPPLDLTCRLKRANDYVVEGLRKEWASIIEVWWWLWLFLGSVLLCWILTWCRRAGSRILHPPGYAPMSDDDGEAQFINEAQAIALMRLQYRALLAHFAARDDEEPSADLSEVNDPDDLTLQQGKRLREATCLSQDVARDTASPRTGTFPGMVSMLHARRAGCRRMRARTTYSGFTPPEQCCMTQRWLPNPECTEVAPLAVHDAPVFCGKFSQDGSTFLNACQDRTLRLYDSESWKLLKTIHARDVGWSILDIDYSGDQRWCCYSSWSPYVFLCNTTGESELHRGLDMAPSNDRFSLFSVKFSPDSREILGGSCDDCVYVYDLERNERTLRVMAHTNDVNTVAWADETGHTFYSGSDDCMVKVWDRRTLDGSSANACVGTLVGHMEGISHIDSKGDGRHLISNGKDQTIKLWDVRTMVDPGTNIRVFRSSWDYRYGRAHGARRRAFNGSLRRPDDTSLMSYRGHAVYQTLIRCSFSPMRTTGQRYIMSGSADGDVYVYDILSGNVVQRLRGHDRAVREASWHPWKPGVLCSSSFDGTVRLWDVDPANVPVSHDDRVPLHDNRDVHPLFDDDSDSE